MSRLTRTSLMLAAFIGVDKVLALLRQVIIARMFGLSTELDAFNVANNVPDLLYALISGGALSIAFIPVLTEVLTERTRRDAWDLFSRIANLTFIITAIFSVVVALLAEPLVRWKIGIAPGFTQTQQVLVTELMRINLIGTLIFSISGLVMAGLQANQHFLLPAIAPMLYNIGQIFGALILAPEKGLTLGPITLPAFGLGVRGMVYGVILGALLHLCIQIPGLLRYQFHWIPSLGLRDAWVRKVLRLFGPRVLTVFTVQLIFLVRDNLASRLQSGSVTALTYGWMIQQVPETLIGTALGIAILPTLSELAARQEWGKLHDTIERAIQVLVALTVPAAVVLMIGLRPLLLTVFHFGEQGTDMLMWVTRGYLLGLTGHCLLEVVNRSFYAKQNARIPLGGALLNVIVYIGLGSLLFRPLGAAGISLTDAVAFTIQSVILLFLLKGQLTQAIGVGPTLMRAISAAVVSGGLCAGLMFVLDGRMHPVLVGVAAMSLGMAAALPIIWKEIRILMRL